MAKLEGQVESITYANEENGYTVARIRCEDGRGIVTVVGITYANLLARNRAPGEWLVMEGEWGVHAEYGRQFRVDEFRAVVPATLEGIRRYLGSGLIKGLGTVMAGRIVAAFGRDTLSVIEKNPEKLTTVEGIGTKRAALIQDAFSAQKEIRGVMVFLHSYGISATFAARIFKNYGHRAIDILKKNPYALAEDIAGIGFAGADRIARNLGIPKASDKRIESGVLYVLGKTTQEGHIFFPYGLLCEKCRQLLEVPLESVEEAMGRLALEKKIIFEDLGEALGDERPNNKAVYLPLFYHCEVRIARKLISLNRTRPLKKIEAIQKIIGKAEKKLGIRLAENQQRAIACALGGSVMVLTGGPGTGKTTILSVLLEILRHRGVRVQLAAPTGRAAKRLSEATGKGAKTIHRLLEFSFKNGGFQRKASRPLDCDFLVVDEASMIDAPLMHHLVNAIAPGCALMLVGDVHQLPSVGAGSVLSDIISSSAVPVVELNEIFRQAKTSDIIVNAHLVNSGKLPKLTGGERLSDFYFIEKNDPEAVVGIILRLIETNIPRRFDFDPFEDIQVLSPMHKGIAGTGNLNREIQELLNPSGQGIQRGEDAFRIGDKVMQVRNNYDKDVYNGDIGRIRRIDSAERQVLVRFDGRDVDYDFNEMDELMLAYAVSVHKSQGSEYPAVIIPVLSQHYVLLQRNLIYTAMTRGRRLVVMVGAPKALAIAIKNNKPNLRYTRLEKRLQWAL